MILRWFLDWVNQFIPQNAELDFWSKQVARWPKCLAFSIKQLTV